jgi:hypothetical protein
VYNGGPLSAPLLLCFCEALGVVIGPSSWGTLIR